MFCAPLEAHGVCIAMPPLDGHYGIVQGCIWPLESLVTENFKLSSCPVSNRYPKQGNLLQSVTGQMSNHICSVSAHFFPGLTKLAGRNNLPLIEMSQLRNLSVRTDF